MCPSLREQRNPNNGLYLLAEGINWVYFEEVFKDCYSDKGRPAHPIRLMVSLLILKQMYNLSDEGLVEHQWVMNPYYQYLGGYGLLRWGRPCAASDLVHFRDPIGQQSVEKILKQSIELHGQQASEDVVSRDTTVQQKNITFPTDAKLQKKVIDRCVKLAGEHGVELRQSYKRVAKRLIREQYHRRHPSRARQAAKARRRLQSIAGRLVRELH